VFTDKDQETLEAMLPTRNMNPDAAAKALDSVKMLVSLKLQNPRFDISAYGISGVNKSPPAAASATTQTPVNQPSSARSQADAILSGE